MPKKKTVKHEQKLGLKSWLMTAGLIILVGLMLFLAKLKTPQDIRQKAAGSECYLVVRDVKEALSEVIQGAGGKQQIGGVTYCVGGVGNDADRYLSFYDSKIAGQTDLKDGVFPCAQAEYQGLSLGESCRLSSGKEGKLICVGGPREVYLGCIGGDGEQKFYERVAQVTLDQVTSQALSLAPSPTPKHFKSWLKVPVTLEVEFEPKAAFDPTRTEKNRWPWLVLLVNNGAGYRGAYDQADCSQAQALLEGCGQPNRYLDKLWDNFQLKPEKPGQAQVVKRWEFKASDLLFPLNRSKTSFATKISLVFYNGFWDGDKLKRGLAIKSIKFLAPDKSELLSFSPKDGSFWLLNKKDFSQRQSFYFDLGVVNDQGKEDESQAGLTQAFDKLKLEDINLNRSQDQARWLLNEEGSFNLVTLDLSKKVRDWWQKNQSK